MEGLKFINADMVVYVHPSKASKPLQAVNHQLSLSLFTFHEAYDGILLAYSFDIQHKTAKVLPGLIPYFGVNLKAKLMVFSPKPNMLIEGKVVKLRRESIHITVLGTCSAVITSEDIRKEFVYKYKEGNGLLESKKHKKHIIKQGTMLRFTVKSLDEELLHVTGSLTTPNTGCIRYLSKHSHSDRLVCFIYH